MTAKRKREEEFYIEDFTNLNFQQKWLHSRRTDGKVNKGSFLKGQSILRHSHQLWKEIGFQLLHFRFFTRFFLRVVILRRIVDVGGVGEMHMRQIGRILQILAAPTSDEAHQSKAKLLTHTMFHNFIFMVFSGAQVGIFAILTILMASMQLVFIQEKILENKFRDEQIPYTSSLIETLAIFNRERDANLNYTLLAVWLLSCLLYLVAFAGLLFNWNKKRQAFRNSSSDDLTKDADDADVNVQVTNVDGDRGNHSAAIFARRNQSLHLTVVIMAIITVILCIIGLILLFSVFQYANESSMESLLSDYGKDSDDGRTADTIWNFTMATNGICCAMDGVMDFANIPQGSTVPAYCCAMEHECLISEAVLANVMGCREKIHNEGRRQMTNIMPIFFLLMIGQIFIIVFGYWTRFCQMSPDKVSSEPSRASMVLLPADQ